MLRFLTAEELEALTGRTRASAQRRWLIDAGIPYIDGADEQPRVLEQVVLQRLGGGQQSRKAPQLRLTG